ncbi:MAG: type IV pilus biogenesis/stability protein PilW [Pseudomonadota bacterium]|nr:type IV pilus biogenesis/stability protein PilW [Pseudomonadota bacterium]
MRRPVAGLVLAAMLVAALAGCSRLSFVKADPSRGEYIQVAPDYQVREGEDEERRSLALSLVAAAGEALQAGRLDQASAQAEKALDNDRSSAGAHTVLALVAERRGDAGAAGRHYAEAVKLAPRRGNALNNYAAWLCSNGRVAESLPIFDRALADRSYRTPEAALANAGRCRLMAGEGERAERYLRLALEMDKDNPVALAGMARYSYDTGDYLQARAFSERRLAAAAATPEVLQLASQIEQKLGDMAASADYVQRMRNEFPQSQTPRGGVGQQ